jgi:hypothetical protein
LLLAAGCNSDPKGDLFAYHVVFVGTVKDTVGAPIGSAVLAFEHDTLDACTGTGRETQSGSTETNGTYRLDFTIVTSIGGCVRILAHAPGYLADSATLVSVPFLLAPATDSVRTDFVLRR